MLLITEAKGDVGAAISCPLERISTGLCIRQMSFLPFFHALIANGTIPYGHYGFLADNGNNSLGQRATIESNDFTVDCIQKILVDTPLEEGASLHMVSGYLKFTFTFVGGQWEITRIWKSPVPPLPAHIASLKF